MRRFDPRRTLSAAPVYRLFRRLIVRPRRDAMVIDALGLRAGHRVLDLGCGGGDAIRLMPEEVRYVGVDASGSYIEAARRQFGHRGEFHVVEIGTERPPRLGRFDRVLCDGVLHHLDDRTASTLLRLAASVLHRDGYLVTIDPCVATHQRWLARRLIESDRGEHVRDDIGYRTLARHVFSDVRVTCYDNLLRLPYDHLLMVSRDPVPEPAATP